MAAAYMYMFLRSGTKMTRQNLSDYDQQYLIERYFLDRHLIENVRELVRSNFERPTKKNNAVSVSYQVLTALRFYATGNFSEFYTIP